MTPDLQAIADRFIYEHATLKHMLTLTSEADLGTSIPGSDWMVRQCLAHLSESLGGYAERIEAWLNGAALEDWSSAEANAEVAARSKSASAAELTATAAEGLRRLLPALRRIPEEHLSEPSVAEPAMETLKRFQRHASSHGPSLLEALPALKRDPLVLSWLLRVEFADAENRAWQSRLLAETREYLASLPDDDEEDDE
jgi:hypothetical protein